jgi:hypothetical protein
MGREYLRRYTNIPALIHLLSEQKITLLDPQSWDDTNDSHYLELYREKKCLASVLALCFTRTTQTYHHWRIFAGGSSGVCIRFERSELLNALKKQSDLRVNNVTYRRLDKIGGKKPATKELPFLKRYPFKHEKEFRVIYESRKNKTSKLDINIPLSCINKITLSPWLAYSLFSSVKQTLRSIKGCRGLTILRSTLIGNEEWKKFGESAN